MYEIRLSSSRWKEVRIAPNVVGWVSGQLFDDAGPISWSSFLAGLYDDLRETGVTDAVSKRFEGIKGFYAIVLSLPHTVFAAVDHVRSFPLFYAETQDAFVVGDRVSDIQGELDVVNPNHDGHEQFRLSGYVSGSKTLIDGVFQILAGEFLRADVGLGGVDVQRERYYVYRHADPEPEGEGFYRASFENAVEQAILRLREYVGDRQVVVPLSGGYDSRLILTLLRKHGFENVLAFSYGVAKNRESQFSERVAKSLCYEWVFIAYSVELWQENWFTPLASQFCSYASNQCSLPHVQDWLAVKAMREQGLVSADSVFVPGHSGDFVAGSHLPDEVFSRASFSKEELLTGIFERHYQNVLQVSFEDMLSKCRSWIDESLCDPHTGTPSSFASLYEQWEWQERQAKYIINSVRTYEFFDCDWWLPLWDQALLDFWKRVPLEMRRKRAWYNQQVSRIYAMYAPPGTTNLKNAEDASVVFRKLLGARSHTPRFLRHSLVKLKRRIQGNSRITDSACAYAGLIPPTSMSKYSVDYNFPGIFSDLFISGEWGSELKSAGVDRRINVSRCG